MNLHRINALLLKYYYITISRADRIFDIVYWPIIDMFIWGFFAIYFQKLSDVNVISVILGAVILWVFVWRSAQDVAVFVLEDFWSRNLYHLFSSPVKISEHMISVLLLGLIRSILTFIAMVIFGALLYSFNILSINPLLLGFSVFLLTLFGWAMGLFVTAFIFRYGQRIQVIAWSFTFLLQPFACVYYPLSALPPWAAKIAVLLPPTYVFEALRSSIFGKEVDYGSLVFAFVLTLIFFALMVVFLVSSFRKSRKTGLLAKGD